MGVGRFAFTPMLPLMVRDGDLSMNDSPGLAAVNYLGYLVGALTAGRLPMAPATSGRGGLVGVALVTAGMGVTAQLPVWLLLRGLAGLFSGWALVGVKCTPNKYSPPARTASAIAFMCARAAASVGKWRKLLIVLNATSDFVLSRKSDMSATKAR